MARQAAKSDKINSQTKPVAPPSSKKPTVASVLTAVGGIIILLFGVFDAFSISALSSPAVINNITNSTNFTKYGVTTANVIQLIHTALYIAAAVGIICGLIVLASGALMYSDDRKRVRTFAIIALIFSILSVFSGGGKLIGMALGIIGSVLALIHKG